jgi:DNA-directed RNA polymerase specialized sigma24 family protein
VEYAAKLSLVDAHGQPFPAHIERALHDVEAKLRRQLRRQCPALADDVVVAEILEEAGAKIVRYEAECGPIKKLHGCAWVAVKRIATSRMRRGSMRLARATLGSAESEAALNDVHSHVGTADQVEFDIEVSEVIGRSTPEEQVLLLAKLQGRKSHEIARDQGTTVSRVDTAFHRLKARLRDAYEGHARQSIDEKPPQPARGKRTRTA